MPNLCYQSSIRPHGDLVATGTVCRPRGPSVVTGTVQATGASWRTQVQNADYVDPSVVTGTVCRPRGPLSGHVELTWSCIYNPSTLTAWWVETGEFKEAHVWQCTTARDTLSDTGDDEDCI